MEVEFRIYKNFKESEEVLKLLQEYFGIENEFHFEETVMYDNPNPEFTFYNKLVDGRLRLRSYKKIEGHFISLLLIKSSVGKFKFIEKGSYGLVSWKRRTGHSNDMYNIEEEVEYNLDFHSIANQVTIFEKILKCPRVSSYQKIRTKFYEEGMEISVNIYPFGVAFEIEVKGSNPNSIEKYKSKFKLQGVNNIMSCDDMYKQLCETQRIEQNKDISFKQHKMPVIK